jgi:phosphonoacetaldehyde hydrolase
MSEKITTIILDWAGTTVDFGCFAPVDAFVTAFEKFGITPTIEETRAPMGLSKRAHIEKMLVGERLFDLWKKIHGREFTQSDINCIYTEFEPALFSTLDKHADIIPNVLETVAKIREAGIQIGSTTGYTRKMMEVVAPAAKAHGYAPDSLVCPDETGGRGRPFPYMLWRNLELLGTPSIGGVLKVGDTAADIEEGKNAGCVTVGVIKGSSMLGLSLSEYNGKTEEQLRFLHETTRRKYMDAGADFVLDTFDELCCLTERLNEDRA